MIPQSLLDDIASRVDLVELVGEYVSLKKAGRNFKGLCPFHNEKSPSFVVSIDKQIFHCFGCGAGGNVFGFLTKIDKAPFMEVVEKLAQKTGVILPKNSFTPPEQKEERELAYKVNRYAAWFYNQMLTKKPSSELTDYLKKRNLNPEIIDDFKLGFAPTSWSGLADFLQSKQVPLPLTEKLGLVRLRQDQKPYDFFRNRLMFPVMDQEGRVIAFGGRRLADTGDEAETAKYINSPDSLVYHKGLSVYGLYQAKKSIRETETVLIVEGNIDLIRLHQFGFTNTVAPLGTALTDGQIRLLKRYAQKFILLFDGDAAGLKAAVRALPLFLNAGIHPHILQLPEGDDPDTFLLREGKNSLKNLIDQAPLGLDWTIQSAFSQPFRNESEKIKKAQEVWLVINQLPTPLEQKNYASKLARLMGLEASALGDLIRVKKTTQLPTVTSSNKSKISLERILLGLYVKDPSVRGDVLTRDDFIAFKDPELSAAGLLLCDMQEKTGEVNLRYLPGNPDDPAVLLLAELACEEDSSESADQSIGLKQDVLRQWQQKRLKSEIQELTEKIRQAELKLDQSQMEALLRLKNDLAQRLTRRV